MTTFFSYNALVGQRAAGYKNTAYALAELIDNSFDANANLVRIILIEKRVDNRRKVDEILVLDDGDGMDQSILQGALQFGNTSNSDIDEVVKKRRKGKFGYGLPNASLSQSPSIHVYSWCKKEKIGYVYLDLDELKHASSIEIPPVKQVELPDYYASIIGPLKNTGTIVSWRSCDRLSFVKGDSIANNSVDLLGKLYRYLLINGKKIVFEIFEYNGSKHQYNKQTTIECVPNDPLFLMPNTVLSKYLWQESHGPSASGKKKEIYSKYSKSPTECSPTNEKLVDHCFVMPFKWRGKTYEFELTTSVALLDIQKPGQRDGGSTTVGDFYGKKESAGNISFVRADREIASGVFGAFYNRTYLPNRYWSLEVKFNADADDLLGVHNNKQGIEFVKTDKELDEDIFNEHTADLLQARAHCWLELSNKISSAISDAGKHIKKQATQWEATHTSVGGSTTSGPQIPTSTSATTETMVATDGKRPRKLKKPEIESLEKRLIEKYPQIDPGDICAAVESLDEMLTRACVLYAPAEAKQLWSYTKVHDFVVVLVNTNHEFYRKILGELRANGQEGALTAFELLLSSLALEEEDCVSNEKMKLMIESYREAVGSKLHRYMINLPDSLDMGSGNDN